MAVVNGPLMSHSASGQFAKTLIFQPSNGRHHVKHYAKPNWHAHPATAAQLEIQFWTKFLMQHWPDVSPSNQATWDTLATPNRISRVNSYLKENYTRLFSDRTILDGWPDTEAHIVAGALTAHGAGPAEDCLGNYERIRNQNGKPAYKRIATPAFYVYYHNWPGYDYAVAAELHIDPFLVGTDEATSDYFRIAEPYTYEADFALT